MSTSTSSPQLTPFEGSTLAIARNAVIHAFQTGNQTYAREMLQILYIGSAKSAIIEECEKFEAETNRRMKLMKTGNGLTTADRFFKNVATPDEYLKTRNIELFKKIMLLFEKHGLTEFSYYAKPIYNNRPKG